MGAVVRPESRKIYQGKWVDVMVFGNGYGSGYGFGDGYGYGNGCGNGRGYGNGNGTGYGCKLNNGLETRDD